MDNPEVENLDLACRNRDSEEKRDTVVIFSISCGLNIYKYVNNIV